MRRYIDWALIVIAWDGLLPVAVVGVPALVTIFWPKAELLEVLSCTLVPIGAFFVRCVMAHRHFQSDEHYGWQGVLFVLAIFYLVFVEAMLILFGQLGNGVLAGDWHAVGIMYLIYLAMVGLALFPFRSVELPPEVDARQEPPIWDKSPR